MPIINPTLPNDGETADAADVNSVFTAILGVLNGSIDSDNLADGAVTAAKLASGAITLAKIADGLLTPQKFTTDYQAGWQAPAASFAYSAVNQISVSVADAALLKIGTKLKFTQTTVKYFYVTAISGTTVTISGGSDYTLVNAAITAPFFSNVATPFGFPKTFAYVPSSVVGWSSTTVAQYRFRMQGAQVTVYIYITGTSNSGPTSIKGPVVADNALTFYEGQCGLVIDNGSATGPGRWSLDNSGGATDTIGLFVNQAGSNFTASGTKAVRAMVIYEANG